MSNAPKAAVSASEPSPMVGKPCRNRHSGKTYKITSWGSTKVVIKRDSDGEIFKLDKTGFAKNYIVGKAGKDGQPEKEEPKFAHLVMPEERHRFENMVLFPECVQSIRIGMNRILNRAKLVEVWNIDKIEPKAKTILSFHGPPGTGKTMAALCLGREFNRPIMQADYSQIVSCLHGQSGKHIATAFQDAREANAILFFDEADALVSKRISMHADRLSIASAVNQERTVFMQELDRFEGIVILTTNFFKNYDEAILRRIAQHVHFKLPNLKMRERLFVSHVPNTDRVRGVNWRDIALASKGLSGGDIFQVVVNAINAASLNPDPATWWLTQEVLLDQIRITLKSKEEHAVSRRPSLASLIRDTKSQDTPPVAPAPDSSSSNGKP